MRGTSYVTCYHPELDEVFCEIKVKWKYISEPMVMYYPDGSGHPGAEEFVIEDCEVYTYCNVRVTNEEDRICPNWIDWDRVNEEIFEEIIDD
mgnify:CR=1 FL=1|jgi:hypothetical protein